MNHRIGWGDGARGLALRVVAVLPFLVAAAAVVGAGLYFSMPEPLVLKAPQPISFPLKLGYLEKPIKIGYLLRDFSGNLPKVVVTFEFHDKDGNPPSRLAYVLSGADDYWNYQNVVVSGVSYVTIRRDFSRVGKAEKVVFVNILKDYNEGAARIGARKLGAADITSATVYLQAWYDSAGGKPGEVSASFYFWDKYGLD
ncbi:MAG: hypothetical protein A2516_02605 [Alphaproteobacteria bacterium RIFOXYD12_FULL_60_8]|nr:MAG: hypothetical protein A2516_02605 [Alphaproteobacteria bacterium RIFOXYD12_FULL_60_8]